MIVVDTSALMAILLEEPERRRLEGVLLRERCAISAGTLIETERVALVRGGQPGLADIDRLRATSRLEVIATDEAQALHARMGMLAFGMGRASPPAVLNFGDLFAYALARSLNSPLLFKGDDFSQTDVIPALS